MRIVRTPVFHPLMFKELLDEVMTGQAGLRYRGKWWAPLVTERTFSVYRRAPDLLAGVQEQVETYEFSLYAGMLRSYCGPDGKIRPRSRLWRGADGVYRTTHGVSGGEL